MPDGSGIIFGPEAEFNSDGDSRYISCGALDATRFVVGYSDYSSLIEGIVCVGTVSGLDLTFGSGYEFASVGAPVILTSLSSSGLVVAWRDGLGKGQCAYGSVSGDTINYGDTVQFHAGIVNTATWGICSLSASEFVLTYMDSANSNYGTAVVGSISGTTISLGTPAVFSSGISFDTSPTCLSESGFVISFKDGSDGNYGKSIVGTIVGTDITFTSGTITTFNSALTIVISSAPIDDENFIIAYSKAGVGYTQIGMVSGTTITFGDQIFIFDPGGGSLGIEDRALSVDIMSPTKCVFAYHDKGDSWYGKSQIGIIDGSGISLSPVIEFLSLDGTTEVNVVALDSDNFVVAYKDSSDGGKGTARVGTTEPFSASGDLFTRGYDIYNASGDLFVSGHEDIEASGDLFVIGRGFFQSSGDLFIIGHSNIDDSMSLFVQNFETITTSGDFFIHGHEIATSMRSSSILIPIVFGDESEFVTSGTATYISTTAISATKMVVAYRNQTDPGHGTARIGTVTGTDITFGDESEFMGEGGVEWVDVATLDETRFIVVYKDGNDFDNGTAKIGTVSDTDITFGDESEFVTGADPSYYNSLAVLSTSGFVVAYQDRSDSLHGTAKFGTVSGTTITFGSEKEFLGDNARFIDIAPISSSGFIVVYEDVADSNHGTAKVGIVNGTTITFGTELEFLNGNYADYIAVAKLDTNKFVVVYRDGVDSGHGTAKIGTISGTTITFGAEKEFASSGPALWNSVVALSSTAFAVVYKDQADSNHGTIKVGTVNGTDIIFGDESEFLNMDGAAYNSVIVLDDSKIVVSYMDQSDSGHGTSKVGPFADLVSTNLFVEGYEAVQLSSDLFIEGLVLVSGSHDLFVTAFDNINTSGDLFVEGHLDLLASGNLFIRGMDSIDTSSTLFVYGQDNIFESMSLLILSPPPDIYGIASLYVGVPESLAISGTLFLLGPPRLFASVDLFINGAISGVDELRIINRLTQTSDYYPQLVSTFSISASSVNIEVWDVVDGQNTKLTIANSGCYAIGDTGKWGWSTKYLSFTGDHKKYHYYYRMTSDMSTEQYGEFLITVPERGRWSYPD